MKIGLIDADQSKFPNLALMKLSAYHKSIGDTVNLVDYWDTYDRVYVSKVFTKSLMPQYIIRSDDIRCGGLHFSYDAQSISSMKRTKKAAEYHNQHSCRKNPANGYCETCVNAITDILGMYCEVMGVTRSKAPHPCPKHEPIKNRR